MYASSVRDNDDHAHFCRRENVSFTRQQQSRRRKSGVSSWPFSALKTNVSQRRRLRRRWLHIALISIVACHLMTFCDAFQIQHHHIFLMNEQQQRRWYWMNSPTTTTEIATAPLRSLVRHFYSQTLCFSTTRRRASNADTNNLPDPGVYGWRNYFQRRLRTSKMTTTTTSSSLHMGKGDGKKKRKKSSSSSSSPPPATSRATTDIPASPPRVSSSVNIPVRQQIAWANLNKDYRQQQQQGSFRQQRVVRTSYRRTWVEEEIEEKALERRKRGQDPDWDVILNRTAASPLMIVDGYNIIHHWPRLKKHMTKGDPGRARQLLVDDLENLQSIKGWRIECVFDGTKRSTMGPLGHGPGSGSTTIGNANRGLDQATKKTVSKYGVRVVFTGVGIEADSYIESRCARAKNVTDGEFTGSFILATDDVMIRIAGQSAGALCMSANRFVDELKAVNRAVEYRVEAAVAKVNGHSIRPSQLRGRANGAGTVMPTRFGRQSILMEDKRKNRTKVVQAEEEYEIDLSDIQVEEDENGIPWWAKVPDQPNRYKQ